MASGWRRGFLVLVVGSALGGAAHAEEGATVALGPGARPGQEVVNSIGMKLCWIPPGSFVMGSPEDEEERDVDEGPLPATLDHGFWIGKHEVTQAEWVKVMGSNPSNFQGGEGDERRPVETIHWHDARKFLAVLTEQERAAGRLPADWSYRLPSEVEWEYAARAGNQGPRYGGLVEVAWSGVDSGEVTHPVGAKAANAWGLHDVLGNVLEWCDGYWPTDQRSPVPSGEVGEGEEDPEDGGAGSEDGDDGRRPVRGGYWGSFAREHRFAHRAFVDAWEEFHATGFRALAAPVSSTSPPPAREATDG